MIRCTVERQTVAKDRKIPLHL